MLTSTFREWLEFNISGYNILISTIFMGLWIEYIRTLNSQPIKTQKLMIHFYTGTK